MIRCVLPFKQIVPVHVRKCHVRSIVLAVPTMERMNVEFARVRKVSMDENVNVIRHRPQWNRKFNNAKSSDKEIEVIE